MKSHVSMEQHQCPVCFTVFDTGSILLDKRLRDSMERHTVTGHSLCTECEQKKADGYVALVEADERTKQPLGRTLHVKTHVFEQIFNNVPVPPQMVCYVPPAVVDQIVALMEE